MGQPQPMAPPPIGIKNMLRNFFMLFLLQKNCVDSLSKGKDGANKG